QQAEVETQRKQQAQARMRSREGRQQADEEGDHLGVREVAEEALEESSPGREARSGPRGRDVGRISFDDRAQKGSPTEINEVRRSFSSAGRSSCRTVSRLVPRRRATSSRARWCPSVRPNLSWMTRRSRGSSEPRTSSTWSFRSASSAAEAGDSAFASSMR